MSKIVLGFTSIDIPAFLSIFVALFREGMPESTAAALAAAAGSICKCTLPGFAPRYSSILWCTLPSYRRLSTR